MLKQVQLGLKHYSKALPFLLQQKLGIYLIIPFVLGVLIFIVFQFFLGYLISDYINDFLVTYLNLEGKFTGSGFLQTLLHGLVWILVKIFLFLIVAYVAGYLTLIVNSPILALLSEKVEERITRTAYPFQIDQLVRDSVRGISIAIRNSVLQAVITAGLFLLGFLPIPFIGLVSIVTVYLVGCYFYGYSFLDYFNERQRFTQAQSTQYVRKYKFLAITIGLGFSLALMVPFTGSLLASAVAVLSVTAATMAQIELKGNSSNSLSGPPNRPSTKQ